MACNNELHGPMDVINDGGQNFAIGDLNSALANLLANGSGLGFGSYRAYMYIPHWVNYHVGYS